MGVTTAKAKKDNEGNHLTDVWFFDKDGKAWPEKYNTDARGNLISENDGQRWAKAEFYGNIRKCYIKTYRNSRVGEVICDPYSLLGSANDLLANSDLYGSRAAEYTLVGEQMLANYLEYLRTRNPSRVRMIERAFLDGDIN